EDAKEWQRVSAAFEQFKISLNRIKEIAEGFFGGIAAGVVPALQKGLDYLESWESTITEIGQKIGEVIKDLVGSFQNGTFTDIVSLSFQIGFRNAELYAIRFIDTLASGLYTAITEGIGEAFRTAGKLAWEDLKVGLQLAEMDVMQHGYQADLNRKDGPPPDAQRAQEDRDQIARIEQAKNALVQGFIEHATELGKTVLSNLHTGLMSGWNAASQTWNDEAPGSDPELTLMKLRLNRLLEQAGMAFNLETSSNFKQGRGGNLDPVKSHYKFEGTQLEKMGFVMKGAGNPALDFARRTAIATEKMAAFLQGAPAPSSGAMGVNAV
ncbi:MAG: hypothetical protein KGJ09_10870, partial [Candidatus Omnitrophica bacterium]|nr:hypothetical protein [Candidatus Omnitrophota bacterium]